MSASHGNTNKHCEADIVQYFSETADFISLSLSALLPLSVPFIPFSTYLRNASCLSLF